jgi:hypothetical protein
MNASSSFGATQVCNVYVQVWYVCTGRRGITLRLYHAIAIECPYYVHVRFCRFVKSPLSGILAIVLRRLHAF